MKRSEGSAIVSKMPSRIIYPWFFFYRIARLSLLASLPTLFLVLFFYRSSYKEGLVSQMTIQVKESLTTTQDTLNQSKLDWKDWCESLAPKQYARYSLINKQGQILCDSIKEKTGSIAEDLTEVTKGLEENFFAQVRFSDHFQTQSLFACKKVTDDLVLRKVIPITSLKDDMNRFDRVIFLRIVPVAVLGYLFFLVLFYVATRPLGAILTQVEGFNVQIPFNKNLKLLYKQDEWRRIQEALNVADYQLKEQITKVKTENEKISTILESIKDDIIAIDPYETVLFYNSKFEHNFMKEKSYQEITPKIWHTFSDEQVLEAFRTVLRTGEKTSLRGLTFLSSSHPDRFFDLRVTPLKNPDGKINGALGVFYDVTEFKLTEQMRVDFVANVSHEIRTPLTSIKGYTQILDNQKSKIDPGLHLFLEKIMSNTERMISLFNDLLNLSVIESKDIVKFEQLDLSELVQTVASNIRTNYPQKKVEIVKEIQLESIQGDRRLMEQVLSNLVDNACKYAGNDIAIKISTFAKNNKGYIVVADNGPGISKEHLQRIFERFYRIDPSREASRGTGLGLSIVKHIIAKHGGTIWAESDASHGTNFIIELPLT